MATKTREQLLQIIAKAKAEIQRKDARESKARRAAETRQKIIIGGWVMKNRPELVEEVKKSLSRPVDLAAFQVKETPPPAAPAQEPEQA